MMRLPAGTLANLRNLVPMRRAAVVFGALIALLFTACQSTIESGLDEAQANEILVALDRHGIHGLKQADGSPGSVATYAVIVSADDVATALSVLSSEDLPRRSSPGLSDVFDGASLVPTATEESARLRAALGGELERTLESIDGVLAVRVHIALAESQIRLLDEAPMRPRASVLIRHRGQEPPYDENAIKALVAGAIQGMEPSDVAIVGVPASGASTTSARLVGIGPIAVAQSSASSLKLVLGVLLGTNLVLAILLAMTMRRRPRLTSEPKV